MVYSHKLLSRTSFKNKKNKTKSFFFFYKNKTIFFRKYTGRCFLFVSVGTSHTFWILLKYLFFFRLFKFSYLTALFNLIKNAIASNLSSAEKPYALNHECDTYWRESYKRIVFYLFKTKKKTKIDSWSD